MHSRILGALLPVMDIAVAKEPGELATHTLDALMEPVALHGGVIDQRRIRLQVVRPREWRLILHIEKHFVIVLEV